MNKNILFRILFVLGILLITFLLIYFAFFEMMPDLIPIIERGNAEEIEAYLEESSTFKGIACTILLQMVQVWSIFLPGMPIQIAAGAVYDLFPGLVICHLSSVLAQYIAMIVWRKLGKRMEKLLPTNSEKQEKFNAILSSQAPPSFTIMVVCLVPVMPNGVIPLLASKMDITPFDFAKSVWLGSFLCVFLCCAAGNRIMAGDWIIAVVYMALLFVVVILLWYFRDSILKLYYRVVTRKEEEQ